MNQHTNNREQAKQSGNAQNPDQQRHEDEQFWTEWWREYAQTWK